MHRSQVGKAIQVRYALAACVAGILLAAVVAFTFGLFASPDLAWASSVDSAQAVATSAAESSSTSDGPEFRVWPVVLAVVLFVGVGLIAKFGKRK
ncbi:MAG: hypothetical protein IJ131_03450 [Eggerthellaceae bacterium]|nr:hypothetical protein [Eggerthellaceae bacterium]